MKEIKGNLFDYPVICITTNGVVKNNNRLVMGKGIALTAKQLYPDIDLKLGINVTTYGNVVSLVKYPDKTIISFPTKHNWRDNINLIKQSATDLVSLVNTLTGTINNVYLPRTGCGNGNLSWSVVKPVIEELLDDRFIVVSNYT